MLLPIQVSRSRFCGLFATIVNRVLSSSSSELEAIQIKISKRASFWLAFLNMPENHTENPTTPECIPTASTMTTWHSAKLALGSVIILASLTCAAISLAWAKMPIIAWAGLYSFPLYGLPYVREKHSLHSLIVFKNGS